MNGDVVQLRKPVPKLGHFVRAALAVFEVTSIKEGSRYHYYVTAVSAFQHGDKLVMLSTGSRMNVAHYTSRRPAEKLCGALNKMMKREHTRP